MYNRRREWLLKARGKIQWDERSQVLMIKMLEESFMWILLSLVMTQIEAKLVRQGNVTRLLQINRDVGRQGLI